MKLPVEKPALQEIRRIVTIFGELRNGVTVDDKTIESTIRNIEHCRSDPGC
ncbi:MAG: hypothetical protein ABI863_04405 [Ginsengibacter sp.]